MSEERRVALRSPTVPLKNSENRNEYRVSPRRQRRSHRTSRCVRVDNDARLDNQPQLHPDRKRDSEEVGGGRRGALIW
ncbi:uncharacterized protein V6R79_020032 [Siganus canaliculatus]